MARMSIDDTVVRDPRITKLAATLGWSRRETVGCLVMDVWPICYDQQEYVVVGELINIAAGHPGFVDAMVDSGLAERVRGNIKVRIKGARDRIEYLVSRKSSGRNGGYKSGESRRLKSSTPSQPTKHTFAKVEAPGNPSVPSPSPPPVPDPVPDPPPVPDHPESPPVGVPGRKDAIDAFHRAFKARTNGVKPTWGGKQLGQMDGLLKRHSASEVIRRINILFSAPPPFLANSPPDLSTLVQHFDKLAAPAQSSLRKSPTQIALEELERIQSEES